MQYFIFLSSNTGIAAEKHLFLDYFVVTDNYPYIVTDPDPTDESNVEGALTGIGFWNTGGYMILWVAVTLFVVVGLSLLNVSAVAIVIVEFIVTGVFMYLGFLPFYASLIIFALLVMAGIIAIRGRTSYE